MKHVLSVGQCGFDHSRIASVIQNTFEAEVISATNRPEAERLIQSDVKFDLVLVNRVFDANGDDGIGMIRDWHDHATAGDTPLMLVSNFEDAQKTAQEAGAVRGFGKADLTSDQVIDVLKSSLG